MNLYAHLHDTRPRINLADMLTERPQPIYGISIVVRDCETIRGPMGPRNYPADDDALIMALFREHSSRLRSQVYGDAGIGKARIRAALARCVRAEKLGYGYWGKAWRYNLVGRGE